MRKPRVLVACEYSGIVRDAFARRGCYALSCDLWPSETDEGLHHQGDVLTLLDAGWDLMVAHPDCTYLCSSGLHWNKRRPGREQKTERALEFVRTLMDAPIPRITIENPVGRIGTAIRPAPQYIQPYEYGHDASKKTGIWLTNLPKLTPTDFVPPRIVDGKKRWGNQTDSGQNKLAPSDDRWKERSRTYTGGGRPWRTNGRLYFCLNHPQAERVHTWKQSKRSPSRSARLSKSQ